MDESGFPSTRCGRPYHEQAAAFDESFESLAAAFSKIESGGSEIDPASRWSESGKPSIHLKFNGM
ncbi:hypothetical protein BA011_02905 [Rhizobium leguminosarum]|uniref:Uncharacterized protein n=1 Tax=Rhizobium leguminosarum TaxID=384 RepID=A0A1B1C4Y1_RHILE|nr:hypothetical protein BA011_02905 [Rhizobium leguminosarum]